jgi:hypothetical protein
MSSCRPGLAAAPESATSGLVPTRTCSLRFRVPVLPGCCCCCACTAGAAGDGSTAVPSATAAPALACSALLPLLLPPCLPAGERLLPAALPAAAAAAAACCVLPSSCPGACPSSAAPAALLAAAALLAFLLLLLGEGAWSAAAPAAAAAGSASSSDAAAGAVARLACLASFWPGRGGEKPDLCGGAAARQLQHASCSIQAPSCCAAVQRCQELLLLPRLARLSPRPGLPFCALAGTSGPPAAALPHHCYVVAAMQHKAASNGTRRDTHSHHAQQGRTCHRAAPRPSCRWGTLPARASWRGSAPGRSR